MAYSQCNQCLITAHRYKSQPYLVWGLKEAGQSNTHPRKYITNRYMQRHAPPAAHTLPCIQKQTGAPAHICIYMHVKASVMCHSAAKLMEQFTQEQTQSVEEYNGPMFHYKHGQLGQSNSKMIHTTHALYSKTSKVIQ